MKSRPTARGFTLIELVIAMAILAIITSIAYASYSNSIQHSRRSDALTSVGGISSSLERCYAQAYTYLGCGSAAAGTAASQNGYYSISTVVAATTYTLTAKPVGGQAGDTTCASFILSNSGQSATNTGGTDETTTCWGSR
jgi:type IV pilus assembly protein PilE